MNDPKIAIVHDWLTGMRGGEKCLEVFCELFPKATLFTLLHKKGSVSDVIENMDIRTSFLQNIPGIFKNYRNFLPLYTNAVESFDLRGYDLILSSSHCVAKGAKKPADALHICYCYTPVRYAWCFFEQYFSSQHIIKKKLISYFLERLRKWDISSNKKVDYFVAISHNVKNRIQEYYSREADVIYPPVSVDVKEGDTSKSGKDYYLIVSALVPYKRIDIAVEAFNKNQKRLIIIGKGPEFNDLKRKSLPNIEWVGWASDRDLYNYYSGCKALVFPGEEDFGIVPVEAQFFGKPVIAYGKGGILETVIPLSGEEGATGIFFDDQSQESLNHAIDTYENNIDLFDPLIIKKHAERFSRDRFKEEIEKYIAERYSKFKNIQY